MKTLFIRVSLYIIMQKTIIFYIIILCHKLNKIVMCVIQCYAVVCSFTHHLFTHLKFASHVDMAIHKSRSAVHGLLTLKRHGVTNNMLSLFYQSTILSILPSYASPEWYAFTPQYAHDKLESMKYPYFIARASQKPLSTYNTP